jgi:DNA primase
VAVVEGYTDVIAAHQAGLCNFVGTLGTALGDEHVVALRQLADRVVLIFDGDEAGQKAADRSLELFLGHDLDVRVLTLPENVDPAEFLQRETPDAFRGLIDRAVDPMAFVLDRAEARFDLDSLEDSRRAAEWVLSMLGRLPEVHRAGLDVKLAMALDHLAQRLRVPVKTLERRLRDLRRAAGRQAETRRRREAQPVAGAAGPAADDTTPGAAPAPPREPYRLQDLDPLDRELLQIVLNEPSVVGRLISRVAVSSLRNGPLRDILQVAYDLYTEGQLPSFDRITLRLDDPEVRALAAGLLLPMDAQPVSEWVQPTPPEVRLKGVLARLAERQWRERLRAVTDTLRQTDATTHPVEYRALQLELARLSSQRPDTKTKTAS